MEQKSASRGRPPRKAKPFMAPTTVSKSKNQEIRKKLNAKLNKSIGFGTSFAFQANQSSVLTNVTMESQKAPRSSTRAASQRGSQGLLSSSQYNTKDTKPKHTRNGSNPLQLQKRMSMGNLGEEASQSMAVFARSQTLKRLDP